MHLIETHKWLLGAEPPTSTEDTHAHFFKKEDDVIFVNSQRVLFLKQQDTNFLIKKN